VRTTKNKEVRKMSEELDAEAVAALRKKRQFKKFTFRGLELEKIMDLSKEELLKVVHAR
jgi:small subunit ribosomal protein S15e